MMYLSPLLLLLLVFAVIDCSSSAPGGDPRTDPRRLLKQVKLAHKQQVKLGRQECDRENRARWYLRGRAFQRWLKPTANGTAG